MNLGQTLREARKKQGKSLVSITKELGFNNHALVQQIETNARGIPKDRVVDFARVYRVDSGLLTNLNAAWKTESHSRNRHRSNDDFNLMTILPAILVTNPEKLSIQDLLQIRDFVCDLDVPITQELIESYTTSLTNQPSKKEKG